MKYLRKIHPSWRTDVPAASLFISATKKLKAVCLFSLEGLLCLM